MDAYEVGKRIGEMLRADRERGGVGPLERYQGYFPGFEELIAREYAIVTGHDETGPDSRTLDWLPARERQHYRRLGEIARGGMGSIIRIRDETLRRDLAMKVVLTDAEPAGSGSEAELPPIVRRFLNEARITAQLDHPGVVPVHEMGLDAEGRAFFTMKLVKGRTLGEVFERSRTGDPEWSRNHVIQVFIRVLETLAFAHEKGVVHRDLKPDNVMVGDFGEVYVMDWGLAFARDLDEPARETDEPGAAATDSDARLTAAGQVLGTPAYMPVEQARGGEIDSRTDVYAVGAMLYEFLSGHHPYGGSGENLSAIEVLRALLAGPPEPLMEAPPELAAIIGKAMSRKREDRYGSALDLARDLRNFIEGRVVEVHRTGTWVELWKWIGRNRATASAIAVAVVLLVAGFAVSIGLAAAARSRERQANREAYRGGVEAAAAEIAAGNIFAARGRLERLPTRLRGWEWRHLASRLDRSLFDLPACAVAFAADGRVLLGGPGAEVRELDLATGETKFVRASSKGVWKPSGTRRLFVIESTAGFILSRADDGEQVLCLEDEPGSTYWVTSGRFVAWIRSGTLTLLDLTSGRRSSWPEPATRLLGVSSDGRQLALWRKETFAIDLADAVSRRVVATIEGVQRPDPPTVAFSPDGSRILLGSTRSLLVFDTSTGKPTDWVRAEGHTDNLRVVEFSPDGSLIATGGEDRTVRVLNARTGETLRVLLGHERPVNGVVFSPDGTRLMSIGELRRLRVWNLTTLRDPFVLEGHSSFVYPVALTPDGRRILSGGWDGYDGKPGPLRIWDAATGEPVAVLGTPDRTIESLAVTPDGSRVITCGRSSRDDFASSRLEVVDAATGRTIAVLDRGAMQPTISPDGRQLAAIAVEPEEGSTGSPRLLLLDPGSLQTIAELRADGTIQRTAFSPPGDRVAGLLQNGDVAVWETKGYRLLQSFPAGGARAGTEIFGKIRFSPDGERLLIAAPDGTVRILDARTGGPLATLRGHEGPVFDALQTPNGRRIFSAGRDRKIRVWDAETFEPITDLPGHESYVYSLALAKDGEMLVSGSGDGTLRIWDTRPAREREQAIRERRRLAVELQPIVTGLFENHGSAEKVMAELREKLDGHRREVALQIALGRAGADPR